MNYIGMILILVALICMTGSVQAYIIEINCPSDIQRGIPLEVIGTTTFPQSASFDLVVYWSERTASERARQTIITTPSQQFKAVFETKDLEKGQYKVEVSNVQYSNQKYANSQLGSASVLYKIFKVIDRSEKLHISSPLTQPQDQALLVSGSISDYGSNVVEIRVFGPDGFSFGPQSVISAVGTFDDDGYFSFQIPVTSPGAYYISLSDTQGFLTEIPFTVTASTGKNTPDVLATLITPDSTPLPATTSDTDTKLTSAPQPAPTRTPLSSFVTTIAIGVSMVALVGTTKRPRS